MGIKEILARAFSKSEKYKEMEEDYRLQKILHERQKSSNERELERFHEEGRQKRINEDLNNIRKKKQREMWTHNVDRSNMFKGQDNILKQKSLFEMKHTLGRGSFLFK